MQQNDADDYAGRPATEPMDEDEYVWHNCAGRCDCARCLEYRVTPASAGGDGMASVRSVDQASAVEQNDSSPSTGKEPSSDSKH